MQSIHFAPIVFSLFAWFSTFCFFVGLLLLLIFLRKEVGRPCYFFAFGPLSPFSGKHTLYLRASHWLHLVEGMESRGRGRGGVWTSHLPCLSIIFDSWRSNILRVIPFFLLLHTNINRESWYLPVNIFRLQEIKKSQTDNEWAVLKEGGPLLPLTFNWHSFGSISLSQTCKMI